jgi:hypothetical protein
MLERRRTGAAANAAAAWTRAGITAPYGTPDKALGTYFAIRCVKMHIVNCWGGALRQSLPCDGRNLGADPSRYSKPMDEHAKVD